MATQRERLVELFAEFGIELESAPSSVIRGATGGHDDSDGNVALTMTSGTPHVDGYGGFYADFTFTKDGVFVGAGVWE